MNYAITRRGVRRRRDRIPSSLETKNNPTYFLNVQRRGHRSVLTTVQCGLYWHLVVRLLADTITDPHWTAYIQYGHTIKTKRWTITTAIFFLCFFITLAERGKYCSLIFETQVLITSTWNWAFFLKHARRTLIFLRAIVTSQRPI